MSWLRRLLHTVRRHRLDREIERELAFHLAERADDLRREGLDDQAARREARLRFGNPLVQAERTRDVHIARALEALARNLRLGIRSSLRTPGFSATVVLTLALGIGLNAALFSTLDAVLFRPLPVPDGDRLVRVMEILPSETNAETPIAPSRLEEWAGRTTALEGLAGFYVEDVSDTTGSLPERIRRAVVSPRFLDVWRVAPLLGRDFSDDEQRAGGPPAVLISDRYWRTRFAADPGVLNHVVRIEDQAFSIAGVMPASFRFPDRQVDLWWPYPVDGPALQHTAGNRRQRWYTGIGRLEAGVTAAQAQADLTLVQSGLASTYPDTDADIGVRLAPYRESVVGSVRGSLWLLFGAVSLLLLIACTNIAALCLSRAARRKHEVAVQFHLGATRTAVGAQLFTETAVLACAGAALGVGVAVASAAAIRWLVPGLPLAETIAVDGRILAYIVPTTMAVMVLCGLWPAVRGTRPGVSLAGTGRGSIGGRHRLQWLLVGVQVCLSVVLLLGAGLLVRSVDALSRVDPGFDPDGVLVFRVSANWDENASQGALVQRIQRTLDGLGTLPGVDAAATSWRLPGTPARYQSEFTLIEGRAASEPALLAEWRTVSPAYFDAMRIPVAEGALCREPLAGEPTAELMVNRRFVERYFPDRSSIGLHLSWESASQTARIAGVVGDARELGLDRDASPTVYACHSAPSPFPWFIVRTAGSPAALAPAVRRTLKDLEPLRSVYDISPLPDRLGHAYAADRMRASLLTVFAVAALTLACLGIYGTLSYVVGLRRREVSLRLALGAPRRDVVRQMMGRAVLVVGLACVCGVALALALTRALSGMLFGVSPTDPATFLAVLAVVLALGGAAALVPAARATLVQPMQVLRED